MRYIDVEPLEDKLKEHIRKTESELMLGALSTFLRLLDITPTADVVPVTRCKDCRWWTKQEKSIQGRCALTGTYPTGGWYCGNGERRDDEIDRR